MAYYVLGCKVWNIEINENGCAALVLMEGRIDLGATDVDFKKQTQTHTCNILKGDYSKGNWHRIEKMELVWAKLTRFIN